jgi:hypothetical protein
MKLSKLLTKLARSTGRGERRVMGLVGRAKSGARGVGRKIVKGFKMGSRKTARYMPGLLASAGGAAGSSLGGPLGGMVGARLGRMAGTSLRKRMRVQSR